MMSLGWTIWIFGVRFIRRLSALMGWVGVVAKVVWVVEDVGWVGVAGVVVVVLVVVALRVNLGRLLRYQRNKNQKFDVFVVNENLLQDDQNIEQYAHMQKV